MRWQTVALRTILAAIFVALLAPAALAQLQAGVAVDAQGVLEKRSFPDPGGQLMRQRVAEANASLNRDVAAFSKLRKVSLNRLEQTIREKNGNLSEEMRLLAGLLRVRFVFFYPESKDIVLAGPAEGWVSDMSGRVVGLTSGRPTVQLQDLVVALRAFPPGKQGIRLIGCSIDPTPEGLQAMQQFLRSIGSQATPGQTQFIVDGLRNSLGMQRISIDGVHPSTHFAQVMVEADYRMKLIGIGLEQPPVQMVSFIEKANPAQVSRNALFRWYFMPDYNCVRVSDDRQAMELVGDGVKLVGEDELVAGGERKVAGRGNKASQLFVASFTKKYSELADRSPVYAELRNLIDLAVAAAYIQQENLYSKAGWKMEVFGNEKEFAVETYSAPKQVASTVAAIWRGNRLMTPIGGGVHIEAQMAIKPENLLSDEEGKVGKLHDALKPELAKGQWWWD